MQVSPSYRCKGSKAHQEYTLKQRFEERINHLVNLYEEEPKPSSSSVAAKVPVSYRYRIMGHEESGSDGEAAGDFELYTTSATPTLAPLHSSQVCFSVHHSTECVQHSGAAAPPVLSACDERPHRTVVPMKSFEIYNSS